MREYCFGFPISQHSAEKKTKSHVDNFCVFQTYAVYFDLRNILMPPSDRFHRSTADLIVSIAKALKCMCKICQPIKITSRLPVVVLFRASISAVRAPGYLYLSFCLSGALQAPIRHRVWYYTHATAHTRTPRYYIIITINCTCGFVFCDRAAAAAAPAAAQVCSYP